MNKWVFVLICSLPSPSTHCYLDFTNRAPKNNFFVVTRRSFFSRIQWTFSRCLFYLTALWHFTHLTNFFFRLAPSLGFGDRGSCWFSQDNTDRSFLGSSLWLLSLCSLLTLGIYQGLTLGSFLLTPSFPFGQLVHNQGFNSHPGTDGLKGKPMSQTSLWNSSLVMPAAYFYYLEKRNFDFAGAMLITPCNNYYMYSFILLWEKRSHPTLVQGQRLRL